ncbi:MAG: DUF4290 domain-containing protein [Bacteroidota bacterium]
MFIPQAKPKDFDCGYNLDLMIAAIPKLTDDEERLAYAKRVVGLIKQSHPSWVADDGTSRAAWDHFFDLAEFDLEAYGIKHPFTYGAEDDAQ